MNELQKILIGIDLDETQSDDGWWPTSIGAEFGAKKLAEVVWIFDRLTKENEQLRQELESQKKEYGAVWNNWFQGQLRHDELAAYVDRLRDELGRVWIIAASRVGGSSVLHESPPAAIAEHDKQLRDKVIDECARECDAIAAYGAAKDCVDDIRSLKGEIK